MNFVQWLNSLDDFLFELMSWIVLFPVTLWRAITRPLATMRYAQAQLVLPPDDQYDDTVSPPVFLVLSLLLTGAVELALFGTNPIVKSNHGLAALVTDSTSLLLLRLIVFSTFPVIMATRLVRRCNVPFDRKSLKPPIYAQCYVAAPFALGISIGASMMAVHAPWMKTLGMALILATFLFYGITQARWFSAELGQSFGRGFIHASFGMLEGIVAVLILASLFAF